MGEQRTLPLVARYADACNLFDIPDGGATLRHKLDVLARACDAVGRDPDDIEITLSSRLAPDETDRRVRRPLRPTSPSSASTTSCSSRPAPGNRRRPRRRVDAARAVAPDPPPSATETGGEPMAADLDHIIVHATDPHRSAEFLAALLDTAVLPDWGPFVRVQTTNHVTLDYVRDEPPFTEQHCAFLVDDPTFDTAHRRLLDEQVPIYVDPFRRTPGEINHLYGGRGVYFDDPDGHLMELITAPYGTIPKTDEMSKVFSTLAVSVDGYITGRGSGPGHGLGDGTILFDWYFNGDTPSQIFDGFTLSEPSAQLFDAAGQPRPGRVHRGSQHLRRLRPVRRRRPTPTAPLFVLSHRPAPEMTDRQTLITTGIHDAIAAARAAAGNKDVALMGGRVVTEGAAGGARRRGRAPPGPDPARRRTSLLRGVARTRPASPHRSDPRPGCHAPPLRGRPMTDIAGAHGHRSVASN